MTETSANAAVTPEAPSSALPVDAPKVPAIVTTLRHGAIVFGVTVALLEIVLRLLGLGNPILYERNDATGYRIKPDQHVSFLRNRIDINEFGVRDPRPLDTRDPVKKRVVCLGDSVTWGGIYTQQEELFTTIAERTLADTEVINAGVNGYSTTQMARLYENYLTGLNPDLVVFCIIDRDIERVPISKPAPDDFAFPESRPSVAIVEALDVARLSAASRFELDWLRPTHGEPLQQAFEGPPERTNLNEIAALARKLGGRAKTIVVVVPISVDKVRWQMRHQYMRTLRRMGVWATELEAGARLRRGDFVDNVHLSESGHQKIGRALAAVIEEQLSPEDGTVTEPTTTREERVDS